MLAAYGVSDPGPVRKNNQDSFAVVDDLRLFVVADGMGGHAAGEVASGLAVETIVTFIRRSQEDEDVSWPYGIDPELSFDANRLRTAVHLANRRVYRAAEQHDEYTGMGTTVVATLVRDGHASIAHAGDSRAYLLSDGTVRQLTADDTWSAAMPDPSSGTPARSMRHILTNVVGVRERTDVHLTEIAFGAGDVLLLCSDGVHNVVDDETLATMMGMDMSPADIAGKLIDLAIENATRDNVTALIVRNDESR